MTIGSNIKQIRKERKLTQSELAKKINKGLRTVQKYESDDINTPTDVLKDIAKALDVGLVDLLYDNNNAICVDMLRDPLDVTCQKLEILSADENFEKDMLNDILSKKRHELNFFEQCLLVVYDEQTYDASIQTEIFKFLSSDILQKQLGYSFKDLASNKIDLIRISLNIIHSIKNNLKDIENSKKIINDTNKEEINKK